jgi:hypothetical protein
MQPAAAAPPRPVAYSRDAATGDYLCPRCPDRRFRRQNTAHYHVRRHNGAFCGSCVACGRGFLQPAALLSHVRSAHGGDAAALPPAVRAALRAQIAAPAPLFACPAPSCGATARTRANIVVHIGRAHSDAKPAPPCGDCPCGFVARSGTARVYHAMTCATARRPPHVQALLDQVAPTVAGRASAASAR